MSIKKEYKEFHTIDLSSGWATPAGYPEGIQQHILAGELDEVNNEAFVQGICASLPERIRLGLSSTTTGKRFTSSPVI